MTPARCANQAPVPPPAYHRSMATALHLDALTLVRRLELLEVKSAGSPSPCIWPSNSVLHRCPPGQEAPRAAIARSRSCC
jgi:hypothetical protein